MQNVKEKKLKISHKERIKDVDLEIFLVANFHGREEDVATVF